METHCSFICVIDAFMDFTNGILSVTGINATAHIFASYPARHLSVLGGFIDQVSSDLVASSLVCVALFLANPPMQHRLSPFVWEYPLFCLVWVQWPIFYHLLVEKGRLGDCLHITQFLDQLAGASSKNSKITLKNSVNEQVRKCLNYNPTLHQLSNDTFLHHSELHCCLEFCSTVQVV